MAHGWEKGEMIGRDLATEPPGYWVAVVLVVSVAAGCGRTSSGEPGAALPMDASQAQHGPAQDDRCIAPTRFEPGGRTEAWRHDRTTLLVVTQGRPNHRGQDVVAGEGEPVMLVGKFAYGPLDKDLEDEDVDVYMQYDAPCGPWVLLGTGRTTKDSDDAPAPGLDNDGGRVFYRLPKEAKAPKVGRHPVRMSVRGDHSVAAFDLYVIGPGTQAVVLDIDGTLTTDDFQVVRQILEKIRTRSYVPRMLVKAPELVTAWADAGYLPVYLTGRPEVLFEPTREWLQAKAFPPGPVHLVDHTREVLPTNDGVGRYKAEFLQKLTSSGVKIFACYGNASTDIYAYELAGVDKKHTYIIGKNRGKEGTVAVRNYREHLQDIGTPPRAERP